MLNTLFSLLRQPFQILLLKKAILETRIQLDFIKLYTRGVIFLNVSHKNTGHDMVITHPTIAKNRGFL